eukprot:scaffold2929_cov107-Cylindrotheca_fusiformis.AAC.6
MMDEKLIMANSKKNLTLETDSTSDNSDPQGRVYDVPAVAKQEETNVIRAKILVAIILVIAVCSVAVSTFLLVRSQERRNFESQFDGYASEFVAVSIQKTGQLFNAFDAFAVAIGAQAATDLKKDNASWPFYTISDWTVRAERLAELIAVDDAFVIFAPVVQEHQKKEWEDFANDAYPTFYQEAIDKEGGKDGMTWKDYVDQTVPFIHYTDENYQFLPVTRPGETLPVFQHYPLDLFRAIPIMPNNLDMLAIPQTAALYQGTRQINGPTIGFTNIMKEDLTMVPGSLIIQPVYDRADTKDPNREIVGIIATQLQWLDYFEKLLPGGRSEEHIIVVLMSACPKVVDSDPTVVTYQIDGPAATFLGETDLHDPKYDALEVAEVFIDLRVDQSLLPEGVCVPTVTLHVYPNSEMEDSFSTDNGVIYTVVVVVIFIFTSLVFFLYDYFVGKRQRKVMDRIMKQDMIVSNVFPAAIRDRLYARQDEENNRSNQHTFDNEGNLGSKSDSTPLADLFPKTTVVYADIAGFTAWSSAREPHHVFILLETIYGAFDKLAYRQGVFKVETVGDCYVAAVGLPEPVEDHAVIACKFARDCLKKMKETTLKLEVSLGPDTADLELRVGIHSGQVTAGVLRGERSRFQLFGDTMSTGAKMEHTGKRNRIHISQTTADLLITAGFSRWIAPRNTKTFVAGKGEMQTYWMVQAKSPKSKASVLTAPTADEACDTEEISDMTEIFDDEDLDFEFDSIDGMSKMERLVEWNVQALTSLLQQIVASRGGVVKSITLLEAAEGTIGNGPTVLEEFIPIIPLKRFEEEELRRRRRPSSVNIGDDAKSQLRSYLTKISGMYRENPFHNFEHASHVTASVKKLLARIVNMDQGNGLGRRSDGQDNKSVDLSHLAGHSYGITSDPLTQFAVVFSAIIHDVDHPGVPNVQLVKENTPSAKTYKKSIAEQNSVELAWDMLMRDEYKSLRACIYQTESDFRRFRQLVVNTVMATDIVDRELQALRKARWETAFSSFTATSESITTGKDDDEYNEDRKATIVIEHLIQASDVAHTMQHWHIYKSWNEKFFMECYGAYKQGRADEDPSENWYKGEIGFFDYYVIPLAKKLENCGVFGVSSDEYLNYAKANREEWVREGEAMVRQCIAKFNAKQQNN